MVDEPNLYATQQLESQDDKPGRMDGTCEDAKTLWITGIIDLNFYENSGTPPADNQKDGNVKRL